LTILNAEPALIENAIQYIILVDKATPLKPRCGSNIAFNINIDNRENPEIAPTILF